MIVGIGVDIQEVQKISEQLDRETYVRKVFTNSEIEYCRSHSRPDESFTGKFAAKEAFMKAIKAGIRQGIGFKDIEVVNRASGSPEFNLTNLADGLLNEIQADQIHLSISHSGGVAIAMVILEKSDQRSA